CQQESDWYLTF
nr:immunoglobulin light chain junction region [Macaca mulatta]